MKKFSVFDNKYVQPITQICSFHLQPKDKPILLKFGDIYDGNRVGIRRYIQINDINFHPFLIYQELEMFLMM